jgi:hypothetical protein
MDRKQKKRPTEEEETKPAKRSTSKKAAKANLKADDSDEVMADAGVKTEAYDVKNRARVKTDGV